jgi:hypothetical protein
VIGHCAAAPRWRWLVDAPEGLVRILELVGKTLVISLVFGKLGLVEDWELEHREAGARRLTV